jgi:S1-C subfamily serine protease
MSDAGVGTADRKGNEPEPDAVTAVNTGAPRGLWGKRSVRVAASVAAALLAAGITVGVTGALRGSVPATARIPSPPAKDAVFVEDYNGAGQDQQDSVLQYSAPGVVSIRSVGGASLGAGFVITRSGFVLASYHGLQGAGTLTARLVMSGKTYTASLVGSDPEANLALLQLSGTGFTPVAIGTSAGLNLDDRVASGGGTWTAKGVLLSTGAITGIDVPVTLDGKRLTGLLEDSALAVPGNELGGPLFNLSGQVIGLSIGYGAGAGYAVPIDDALQLARQLAGQ